VGVKVVVSDQTAGTEITREIAQLMHRDINLRCAKVEGQQKQATGEWRRKALLNR